MLNQNLKYKIISQLGLDKHSPPQEITLEIRMIQGEPGLISKEAGIALSCPDNFIFKNYYFMVISDPKSYYHARKDPIWQVLMDEEMNSLQKNTTWELVSLPPGRKLVQCKWVFQTKVAADGRT